MKRYEVHCGHAGKLKKTFGSIDLTRDHIRISNTCYLRPIKVNVSKME